MPEERIKELVSTHILKNIPDFAAQTVLRKVLFSENNKIDWQDMYTQMKEQMPEIKLEEETSYERRSSV